MAEPQDAKPEDTVAQGAATSKGPEADAAPAEGMRDSYHDQSGGTDASGEGLGRKDPISTGQNERNHHGVQTR